MYPLSERGEAMSSDTFSLRKMNTAHIPSVAEIEKECFSSPWTQEGLAAEIENPSAEFFVLEENGTVAAYMGMHIILDECYIANVAVRGCMRKKGYGQRLVENAVNVAKSKNCFFITLEVRVSNTPAIALYEKCGFDKVGQRKDFYSAPKENALIMTKYF
jgi:ribosomal-protein-alanine N-acetyltransferase